MRSVRLAWLAALMVAGLFLTGCKTMPFRVISRGEFDRLRQAERLNEEQSAYITGLINEKERLTLKVESLEAQLGDKARLLELQAKEIQDLQAQLEKAAATMPGLPAEVEVFRGPGGVPGVRVGSDILFDPGKATLKPRGKKVLDEIANLLREKPNKLRICGYTDSDPIKYSGWKSNFELSGARALAVLEYLQSVGIDPARMHFAGYGEYALIYNDDGTENKKKSRRAEILLLSETAQPASGQPAAQPGAGKPETPEAVVPK